MRPFRLSLTRPEQPLSDWLGLSSSTLCLVHCLAGPLVLGAALAAGWHIEWLDWLFATVGLVAVIHSVRASRLPLVRRLLIVGMTIFLLGFVADAVRHHSGDWLHLPGAALLAAGHLVNLREAMRCRTGACAHPHHAL